MKPILIKKEIQEDYASTAPFELGPGEDIYLFADDKRVPYQTEPVHSTSEEETDDEYQADDMPVKIDSDSSAALSMLGEDFEVTDPQKIDAALQNISSDFERQLKAMKH